MGGYATVQVGQEIKVPYDKSLFFATEGVVGLICDGIVQASPYRIVGAQPDAGVITRPNVVVLQNMILYVNDLRHSHDLESEDLTTYSTTSTSFEEVLRIDYGAVLNVKELYVKFSIWNSGTYVTIVSVEVSSDGTTWSSIYSITAGATEGVRKVVARNRTMRYLRFMLRTNNSAGAAYCRVRKIVVTV